MKINVIKLRRRSLLLAMLMVLTALLSACVNLDDVPEVNPNEILGDTVIGDEDTSEVEIPTPEGSTEAPKNITVVNIAPSVVAIYGSCEKDATVTVKGGKEDVSTVANGEYFIIQTELMYEQNLLEITATAEKKNESLPREVVAKYNATADTRLDGNSVSIGNDSRLYFDKMLDDTIGSELYTATDLKKIRDLVNSNITDYKMNRAGSQQVEMIYVLIPNSTTMDSSVYPQGVADSTYTTVYDQVAETLGNGNTQAKVVDMKQIFAEALKDTAAMETYGGIYRTTGTNLTDYGSYLTYEAIMKVIAENEKFKDIEIKTTDDFTWETVNAQGGNLVDYRGFDDEFITEDIVVATPNFDLAIGEDKKISDGVKYNDAENGDYDYFVGEDAKASSVLGLSEFISIKTDRSELPSALIYRDDASLGFSDILAERFESCSLYATTDGYKVNLGMTETQKCEGDNTVDYVIVAISEENMTSAAFKDAFGIQ